MPRIRTIRQVEGAAASVGVGLVLLLAALAWQRHARPGDDTAEDAGLAPLAAACEAKLRRDARTVPMTPDAARRDAPADAPASGEEKAAPREAAGSWFRTLRYTTANTFEARARQLTSCN